MAIWGSGKLSRWISNEGGVANCYDGCVNPASVNLRLGDSFATPSRKIKGFVTLGDEVGYHCDRYQKGYLIQSGEFVLATTMESVNIPPNAAAFVQGRSSIGRIGLSVQNAGFVDPGFFGEITLELKNDSPNAIMLLPGYPVAQLILMDADDVVEPYSGKYVGQKGATGSRMFLDRFPDLL